MQKHLTYIKPYVVEFIRFAKEHPELTFLVTRVGCGNEGFKESEIAPLFNNAYEVPNIIIPWEFEKVVERIFSWRDKERYGLGEYDVYFHECETEIPDEIDVCTPDLDIICDDEGRYGIVDEWGRVIGQLEEDDYETGFARIQTTFCNYAVIDEYEFRDGNEDEVPNSYDIPESLSSEHCSLIHCGCGVISYDEHKYEISKLTNVPDLSNEQPCDQTIYKYKDRGNHDCIIVKDKDGNYGIKEADSGKEIFPCQWTYCDWIDNSDAGDPFAIVRDHNHLWGIVDLRCRRQIVPCKYVRIQETRSLSGSYYHGEFIIAHVKDADGIWYDVGEYGICRELILPRIRIRGLYFWGDKDELISHSSNVVTPEQPVTPIDAGESNQTQKQSAPVQEDEEAVLSRFVGDDGKYGLKDKKAEALTKTECLRRRKISEFVISGLVMMSLVSWNIKGDIANYLFMFSTLMFLPVTLLLHWWSERPKKQAEKEFPQNP